MAKREAKWHHTTINLALSDVVALKRLAEEAQMPWQLVLRRLLHAALSTARRRVH